MKNIANPIEILESRIAPSVFIVTSLADPSETGKVTLRDALLSADNHPGPDTIVFHLPAPPLHGENVITLSSVLPSTGNVTIMGPGAGKLIIDGGGNHQVFNFDNTGSKDAPVKISGLSIIRGAKAGGNGGGIQSDVSLTLANVVISDCTAKGGGGVAVIGTASVHPKVTISQSLITGNSATQFGGGIDLFGGIKSLSISGTGLTANTASEAGGAGFVAIDGEGTGLAITNSVISVNSSGDGGGFILENSATAATAKTTITGTLISDNQSTNQTGYGGGGLYLGAGKTVITGSVIEHNTAVYNGGGVEARQFTALTISKSTISGNTTTATNSRYQGGGGVFIDGTAGSVAQSVLISGSTFDSNRSARYGGGLFAYNTQDGTLLTVSGSNFSSNSADEGGGLSTVAPQSATTIQVNVTGGSFSGNTGSAISESFGKLTITGSKVTGNQHGRGAGIYASGVASLAIKNVLAANNQSYVCGGALYMKSCSNFTISGGLISGNAAPKGGAVYGYNVSGSILGATISGNAAGTSGGAVFNGGTSGGKITVQAAHVSGNTAPVGPDFETAGTGTFAYV